MRAGFAETARNERLLSHLCSASLPAFHRSDGVFSLDTESVTIFVFGVSWISVATQNMTEQLRIPTLKSFPIC